MLIKGLFELKNSGWNMTFTRSDGWLKSCRRRNWFRIGSETSSIKLCVTIGGNEFLLRAITRRFNSIFSSFVNNSAGSTTAREISPLEEKDKYYYKTNVNYILC